jgi:phosphoheptose isomerase
MRRALLMGDLREFGDLPNLGLGEQAADKMFAREVGAHGREGDVLKALPTSGNSGNVRQAIEAGGDKGMTEQVLC